MLPIEQRNAGVAALGVALQSSLKPPATSCTPPCLVQDFYGPDADRASQRSAPPPRPMYDNNGQQPAQASGPVARNNFHRDLEFIEGLQTHSDTFYLLGMCEGSRVAQAMKAKSHKDNWRTVGVGRPAKRVTDGQKVVSAPLPRQPLTRYGASKVLTMDNWTPALDFGIVFGRRSTMVLQTDLAKGNAGTILPSCFINNEFVDAISGKTFATINPSTEERIADIASADKPDVDRAVDAARAAFARGAPWRTMDASARGKLIMRYADLLERELDTLATLESLDNGKPLAMAKFELTLVVSVFRYFAGWADKIHGDIIPADGPFFSYTRKEAVGVVGQIIPWNVPMMMYSWKVAPALAAGCCCVVKPAEQTPLTALFAAELAREAGFPPGVLNVLPGFGETAGAAITHHPKIDKVSFTGSTEVGQLIMKGCAESNVKNVTLELGGKNPLIIFDDCDLDMASGLAYETLFANQGQICASPSRIFVHEKIHDEFVKKVVAMAKKRVVGDPFNPNTQQGPQVDNAQFRKVLELIDSGRAEGARLETGGTRHGTVGFFIEPTVFTDVKDHMRIAREEIFGPVMQILKFSSDEEVIRRANDTAYGLAAGVVTKNVDTVQKMTQALEAGTVWVNTFLVLTAQTPFGGYKMSGIGKDLGKDGLNSYLRTKLVIQAIPEKSS